jgi:hypothetical protein
MSAYTGPVQFWVMTGTWTLVVILGVVVTLYGLRAYRNTGSRSMLALAVGFAFLSVGTAGSWFGIYDVSQNLFAASFGCVGFIAAGFAMILYSLHTKIG